MSFEPIPVIEEEASAFSLLSRLGFMAINGALSAGAFVAANKYSGTTELINEGAFAAVGFAVGVGASIYTSKQEN